MNTTSLQAACLLAVFSPVVLAQVDPRSSSGPRGASVTHHAGTLRADGVDYAVRFGSRAVTFTPALGRNASAVELSLEFVSASREHAAVVPACPVPPSRETNSVAFARGDGVVERYLAHPEGVELTYTFAQPLPGDGDLVVRLRVTSNARCAPTAASRDGLHWVRGTHGGVRIGQVFGVDAEDRRTSGTLAFDGTHLELRLPAAFVDRAAYPLVLDPLIGAELGIANGADDDRGADVAYEPGSDRYLVVWERRMNAARTDIMGQRLDGQGGALGGIFPIHAPSAGHAERPAAASVRSSGRFVVAWTLGPPLGASTIVTSIVDPDGTVSSRAGLVRSMPVHGLDLGGSSSAATDVAVIWLEETEVVRGARILVPSSGGVPAFGPAKTIHAPGVGVIYDIAISKTGGSANRFVVGWASIEFATGSSWVQAVDLDADLLGTTEVISETIGASGIDIDGDGSAFMVAVARGTSTRARGVRWNGSDLETTTDEVVIADEPTRAVRDVAIGWLGQKYVATWSVDGGVLEGEIEGIALDSVSCLPCGQRFTFPRPSTHESMPNIAAQRSTGSSGEEAMIVYTAMARSLPFPSDIFARRFEQFGSGGSMQSLGGGCGGAFAMGADGPIAIGNRDLRFTLDGVAGASAAYLFVGLGKSPILCGSCMITDPVITPLGKIDGNRATRSFPITCNPSLVGGVFEFQWAVLGVPSSPCFLIPNLGFSDRFAVTIGL